MQFFSTIFPEFLTNYFRKPSKFDLYENFFWPYSSTFVECQVAYCAKNVLNVLTILKNSFLTSSKVDPSFHLVTTFPIRCPVLERWTALSCRRQTETTFLWLVRIVPSDIRGQMCKICTCCQAHPMHPARDTAKKCRLC